MDPLPFIPSRTKLFGVSGDHLGHIGEEIGWFHFFFQFTGPRPLLIFPAPNMGVAGNDLPPKGRAANFFLVSQKVPSYHLVKELACPPKIWGQAVFWQEFNGLFLISRLLCIGKPTKKDRNSYWRSARRQITTPSWTLRRFTVSENPTLYICAGKRKCDKSPSFAAQCTETDLWNPNTFREITLWYENNSNMK